MGCGTIVAMILPKFSIRTMLFGTAIFAVLSLVLAQAVRGEATAAIAFLIGISTIAVAFVLYFWAFAAAWLFNAAIRLLSGGKKPTAGSPFADAGLPQQIVPPVEPE